MHTPNPWSIVRYGDGSSLVIHSDHDNRVCFMATASQDRPSSHTAIRANANLIAAAPDMFDALKPFARLADIPDGGQMEFSMSDMRRAAAALAKASPPQKQNEGDA